jgi:hypothetical protein
MINPCFKILPRTRAHVDQCSRGYARSSLHPGLPIFRTSGAPCHIHIVPKNWVGTRNDAKNITFANEMKQSVVMCEIAALYIIALI